MLSELGRRPMLGTNDGSFGDEFETEIGALLQGQCRHEADERERELNLYRSGSAPPTVEGSLMAVGGLLSAEEPRSDPEYHSYYYANVNLNPRLPPPLLSREEWRYTNRLNGGSGGAGGIGERRKDGSGNGDGSSLFSTPPGFESRKQAGEMESDWGGDRLIGLTGLGRGSKQKSIAELIQDDIGRVNGIPSRSSSRNAYGDVVDAIGSSGSSISQPCSYSYAAALGSSLSRSATPDPPVVARTGSPCPTPIGQGRGSTCERKGITTSTSLNGRSAEMRGLTGSNSFNCIASGVGESSDLVAAFSDMSLSANGVVDPNHEVDNHKFLFGFHGGQNHVNRNMFMTKNEAGSSISPLGKNGICVPNYSLGGSSMMVNNHGVGNLPLFENAAGASPMSSRGVSLPSSLNSPSPAAFLDPLRLQYMRAAAVNDPAMERDYLKLLELQREYVGALLSPQKSEILNGNSYYGNAGYGVGMPYGGSPAIPSSPGNRYSSGIRNSAGSVMGIWNFDGGSNMAIGYSSSLLEEFKSNKTKSLELVEISGHVVEFSADQYGSRFIQQKLETATTEEKSMVYKEIMPQALALMTDVFGNYVIQKFFEHGLQTQKRELAEKLFGNVLTLSLQMYGCRVIQKAIEVVDLDQKIRMVDELDGNVMRCVRDQNGNHVIQKCIECVPEQNIQFIVATFFDQVVSLSMHPYGCRVIQRILEHCEDQKTQNKVMEEILGAVSVLAQDQYGNYVVQHVLEHGKPHERSTIIKELAGQIVRMSQQKFASNVVEKCLAFGGPCERQLLVSEMLGTTDENEPLQAMMKDQFANYVVQKVLETCDDQQRELILTRIKIHLNALKKYTYGKHIVARVEKLVAAGERRSGAQFQQAS